MGRDFVVGLALVGLLDAQTATSSVNEQEDTHPAVRSAMREAVSLRDSGIETVLRLQRRPAPPPDLRARVVALLPREGALSPNVREARKIAALQPLLALHGRDLDLDVRLFTVGGAAWAGLHARSVVLVSREALDILEPGEFVAVAAHELGHDAVWDAYETAKAAGDAVRLQALELQCDALAVLALEQLGVPPDALVSATRKLASHNARIGWTPDNTRYVPLGTRTTFIRTFAAQRITPRPADMVADGRR
jgi:Zn-dependent protease with chaperone function